MSRELVHARVVEHLARLRLGYLAERLNALLALARVTGECAPRIGRLRRPSPEGADCAWRAWTRAWWKCSRPHPGCCALPSMLAESLGYLGHEFGDVCLILSA